MLLYKNIEYYEEDIFYRLVAQDIKKYFICRIFYCNCYIGSNVISIAESFIYV